MTKIARYIDDPMQFFFWELDEIIIFSVCFGLGMMMDMLSVMVLLAIGVVILFSKVKQGRADGFFLHILYWAGFFKLRGCPPGYLRSYYE